MSINKIADRLPPDIAKQLHPARRKNEDVYWAVRDQLLAQYAGQWIGFADGAVIASGNSPVEVFHVAEATGLHPFFICVGREEQPCRIRRAAFAYDTSYPGEALPAIDLELRPSSGGVRETRLPVVIGIMLDLFRHDRGLSPSSAD